MAFHTDTHPTDDSAEAPCWEPRVDPCSIVSRTAADAVVVVAALVFAIVPAPLDLIAHCHLTGRRSDDLSWRNQLQR
jgi:hypothetical protein